LEFCLGLIALLPRHQLLNIWLLLVVLEDAAAAGERGVIGLQLLLQLQQGLVIRSLLAVGAQARHIHQDREVLVGVLGATQYLAL
jgi:hypothetical protein